MGLTPVDREAARIESERARKEWARYWAQQMPPSDEQRRRIAEIVREAREGPQPPTSPIKRLEELIEMVREEARNEK